MKEKKTVRADMTLVVDLLRPAAGQSTLQHEENLKRYVHLIWRIYERRRAAAIDRKPRSS